MAERLTLELTSEHCHTLSILLSISTRYSIIRPQRLNQQLLCISLWIPLPRNTLATTVVDYIFCAFTLMQLCTFVIVRLHLVLVLALDSCCALPQVSFFAVLFLRTLTSCAPGKPRKFNADLVRKSSVIRSVNLLTKHPPFNIRLYYSSVTP